MSRVQVASSEVFRLGEGPVWDAARKRLLWVDILAGTVLVGRLSSGRITVTERLPFEGMVGAVTVADDGTLLVAAQERLVAVRLDGTRSAGPRIVPEGAERRCNDGSTDPAGRFVVGTLSLAGGASETEVLVRLEHDGRLTELDDDLTLSNGLAWSVDGRRMYSVDTLRRTVHVRDYEASTGAVGPRQVFVQLDDGHPDGCAVDEQDHLWLAVWGKGEVRRYDPAGAVVETVHVPAPHTSCVTFAGDDLDELVVTTATAELSDQQRRAFPDSGRLFTFRAGVRGHPVAPWTPAPPAP